ncbi:MAG: hypothetical protein NVS3B5_01090 [Sphingomicrobium sp.]
MFCRPWGKANTDLRSEFGTGAAHGLAPRGQFYEHAAAVVRLGAGHKTVERVAVVAVEFEPPRTLAITGSTDRQFDRPRRGEATRRDAKWKHCFTKG